MQSIVERINKPIKLIQCVATFNEAEFIELTLKSIYDEVDQIIVIEGAVKNNMSEVTSDGHSKDNTVEIINNFCKNNDPGKKILFISIKRPWNSLEEQKQTFLDLVYPGDWILINDADEFYCPADIQRLRVAIDRLPHVQEFIPLFLHYYRDWNHIAAPAQEWQSLHQRCFKYVRGMKYHNHPTVSDAANRDMYFSPEYWNRRYFLSNWYIYHFGYARNNMDERMKLKQAYYEKELSVHGEANKKFDEKANIWNNKLEKSSDFLKSDKNLIPVILRKHPMFDYVDEHMNSLNCLDWSTNELYGKAIKGEPFGTMWLNQKGLAIPQIPMFHNEAKI